MRSETQEEVHEPATLETEPKKKIGLFDIDI